jgi:hypothetical protein
MYNNSLHFRIPLSDINFEVKVENENEYIEIISMNVGMYRPSPVLIFNFDRYEQISKIDISVKFKKKKKCKKIVDRLLLLHMYF